MTLFARTCGSAILICIIAVKLATAQAPAPTTAPPTALPPGARITLEPHKQSYFLGENILLDYTITNNGAARVTIETGGDYRGASRALRFNVQAFDADGRLTEDPDPSGFNMGGLGGPTTIEPGKAFIATLELIRYRRIPGPGKYRVRVAHDLGWGGNLLADQTNAAPDPRWAEATITLVEPTAEQARAVVDRMYALKADNSYTTGERREEVVNFRSLQYPVYLPILEQRASAEHGDANALIAIGAMPTPEATGVLVRLLDHPDAPIALQAAKTLNFRLPDPQVTGELGGRNPFENTYLSARKQLISQSWDEKFAAPVRIAATRLLAGSAPDGLQCGAFMFEAVGSANDLPSVIRGLDTAIAASVSMPMEAGGYPRPRGACGELVRAGRMLVRRGAVAPADPKSPGEIAIYLLAVNEKPEFRPQGVADRCAGWLAHPIPYIREMALLNAPRPLDEPMLKQISTLLADSNADVQIAACKAIIETKDTRFAPDMLKLLTGAQDSSLMQFYLNDAAVAAGIPRDQIMAAWVERMTDPRTVQSVFEKVLVAFDTRGGYGWNQTPSAEEVVTLRNTWRTFITQHAMEIRQGRTWSPRDPSLPAGLFPAQFHFSGLPATMPSTAPGGG